MQSQEESNEGTSATEFVLVRTFNAPRDLVFKAWTEVDRLKQWWGPKDFKLLSCKMDLRPGGIFLYELEAPNGISMWGKWVIREIVAPERLVFVMSFSDESGGESRHPFSPGWPLKILSTFVFEEAGEKTTLTMRGIPIHATESELETFREGRKSMQMGWGGTMDQLDQYLEKA